MTEIDMSKQLARLVGMPVSEFILHRKPMSLLDRLVVIGPDFAVCDCRISEEYEFLVPSLGVPAYIGIEYMAQCIAVLAGAREKVLGFPPPVGLLLGTRHFKAQVRYLGVGTTYQVECAELVSNTDGMGSFECGIRLDDTVIAAARLSVLQVPRGKFLNERSTT